MAVWVDSDPVKATSDACIRARYIRDGIIKVRPKEGGGTTRASARANSGLSVYECFKVLWLGDANLRHALCIPTSIFGASERHMLEKLERAESKRNDAKSAPPSPWAALVRALSLKTFVCTLICAICGGAQFWEIDRSEKVVGFFSSAKVDGRNAP